MNDNTLRGIACPKCGGSTRVAVTENYVTFLLRQRVCVNPRCGVSFYTKEKIEKYEDPHVNDPMQMDIFKDGHE